MAGQSAQDRAAMAIAAQRVDHAASTIKGLQVRLQGQKAQVLGGWRGNASIAFDRVFTDFDGEFTKILAALEGIHEKLVHTRIQYETTEQEQTDAANAISSLLNG
jgi:WXG100 family type VII secretion target